MKHMHSLPTLAAAALAVCVVAARPALASAQPAPSASDSDKRSVPAGAAVNDEYRLGPGDKLRIEVYKDQQLSQSVQVRPDGKITLPLVGDIVAAGLTPIQLRDELAKSLKEYVNNPVVTVIVVEATAATAYVMGEVAHPGAIKLEGPITVLQALALAGGLKDFANEKNIHVLRKTNTGVQTIEFNYREAVKGRGQPVYLRPGDTVVVPD